MMTLLRPALVMTLLFTLLTGVAYPVLMTGVLTLAAPSAATGSLILRDGHAIGSSLIAQDFTAAGYLHPRPSASGWNAAGTGATNLGPTSAALIASVAERRTALAALNGAEPPIDAVTTSASGLDPDISPQNALTQAARIAAARGVAPEQVQAILTAHVQGRWLGLYGEPRVNVLLTNLALDEGLPATPITP